MLVPDVYVVPYYKYDAHYNQKAQCPILHIEKPNLAWCRLQLFLHVRKISVKLAYTWTFLKACKSRGCKSPSRSLALCQKHYDEGRKKDPFFCIALSQRSVQYSKTHKRRFSAARRKVIALGKWEWKLEFEPYKVLIEMPCYYCGYHYSECGSGIDRYDNTIGYVPGNVVACCGVCNTMKSNFPVEFFFRKIMQIAKKIKG